LHLGFLDRDIRSSQRRKLGGSGDLPGLARCNPSGRRRFQRPSKHGAERLGRPAAKALDFAGHNVERTRREARLDADDGVDDLHRQTRLRQSGALLLFRDGKERERPASDFGDEGRKFRTRQALGAGSVVDRACMAVANQDSGCGGRHVIARNALTAASMAATFCAPRFPGSGSTVEMMSKRSRPA